MRATPLFAALGTLFLATGAMARTETGSFLNVPAMRPEQLVQAVRHDPEVRDRFQRHFGMGTEQLVRLFKSLKLRKLERDGVYDVYNVREDGVVRRRLFTLRKGTVVFADASGRPILKQSCGNPLFAGELARQPFTSRLTGLDTPGDLQELALEEPPALAMASMEDALEPPIDMVAEQVIDEAPDAVDIPANDVRPPAIRPVLPGGPSLSFLPILIAPGFMPPDGGGGEGEAPPVPAPAPLLALATGLTMLAGRRRRKA